MDQTELTAYIIERLGEGEAANEVIRSVCERTNLHWTEARRLVFDVMKNDEIAITRKQLPLLSGLALLTFIGGLAMVGTGAYVLISSIIQNQGHPGSPIDYLWPVLVHDADLLAAIEPAILRYFRFILGFLINPFSAILFGGLMIYASLAGMKDVWSTLLNSAWKSQD